MSGAVSHSIVSRAAHDAAWSCGLACPIAEAGRTASAGPTGGTAVRQLGANVVGGDAASIANSEVKPSEKQLAMQSHAKSPIMTLDFGLSRSGA